MKKESIIKAVLMFGGGFLLYYLLKPNPNKTTSDKTSFSGGDSTPVFDSKNADIVASAYTEALKSGESPERLTELNKELMKDFNMRCYVNESGSVVVTDSKGTAILTK
jgi:hypothetical protein